MKIYFVNVIPLLVYFLSIVLHNFFFNIKNILRGVLVV